MDVDIEKIVELFGVMCEQAERDVNNHTGVWDRLFLLIENDMLDDDGNIIESIACVINEEYPDVEIDISEYMITGEISVSILGTKHANMEVV